MSHELTIRADQTAEMAYIGEVPWHGLGQLMTEGAAIEQWQASAGMDWKIQRSKVRYFADAEGATQLEMPDAHVLFRSDTKLPLGIVSPKYKTVQPRAVLEFFRDLVEGAGFTLETAGTLFGGRKFWALASIGESANILAGDKIRGHLLVATSADGSSSTVGKYVATRVVCNNTLTMAMGETGGGKVNVSHRSTFSADSMKKQLGIVHGQFERFADAAADLTRVNIGARQAESFVRELLRPAKDVKPAESFADLLARPHVPADIETQQRAPKGEGEILRLFNGGAIGSRIPGVQGTAWGMLNAVTEYVDHRATAKTDSHRMNSAWFNGGDDLKTSCFEQLLAMR